MAALSIRSDAVLLKCRNQCQLDFWGSETTAPDVGFLTRGVAVQPAFEQFELEAKRHSLLSSTGLERGLVDQVMQASEQVDALWIGSAGADGGLLEKLHSEPNIRLVRAKGGLGFRLFASRVAESGPDKTAWPEGLLENCTPAILCLIATRIGQAMAAVFRALSSGSEVPCVVYLETAAAP